MLFQLINQQIFTPRRKIITIGNYEKHYKNIQKKQTEVKSINYEGKRIEKLSIDDRVEKMQENEIKLFQSSNI